MRYHDVISQAVGVYRGLESMRRGEGIPVDEAFRQIRNSF